MTTHLIDRTTTRAVIRRTLAADLACPESALIEPGVTLHPAAERPGRRRFPLQPTPLLITTMGTGVAISANPERLPWLADHLVGMERDIVFGVTTAVDLAAFVAPDGQIIIGPTLGYACAATDLRPSPAPSGIALDVVERPGIVDLYAHPGFDHALSYDADRIRQDELAVVATRHGDIVGIAATSGDTDDLWQIGVDVIPTARGEGIGRAVVGMLTARILADGHVPYYTAAASNIGSRSIAIGLGYWPVFTGMRATNAAKKTPVPVPPFASA